MPQTIEKQIIDYIDRACAVSRDCHTLFWLRSQKTEVFKELVKNQNCGGGNFLIGIGSFVSLNYLAKIYAVLSNSPKPKSKKKSDIAKSFIEISVKENNHLEGYIFYSKTGQINEVDAFIKLVRDSSKVHRLGLPLSKD